VLGGFVSVALGVNFEEVDINGSTRIAVPGAAPTISPGGLLALQSNLGHHDRDRFAVVPQIGVTLGYQLTPHVRLQAGYSFLYWSDVVRPGYQIDQRVNTKPTSTPPSRCRRWRISAPCTSGCSAGACRSRWPSTTVCLLPSTSRTRRGT
jgi:hypothetical protein